MSKVHGVAYSLIVINEAAENLDRQALIDAAPRVLSLIGPKSADPIHALLQMSSDSGMIQPIAQSPRQITRCLSKSLVYTLHWFYGTFGVSTQTYVYL